MADVRMDDDLFDSIVFAEERWVLWIDVASCTRPKLSLVVSQVPRWRLPGRFKEGDPPRASGRPQTRSDSRGPAVLRGEDTTRNCVIQREAPGAQRGLLSVVSDRCPSITALQPRGNVSSETTSMANQGRTVNTILLSFPTASPQLHHSSASTGSVYQALHLWKLCDRHVDPG